MCYQKFVTFTFTNKEALETVRRKLEEYGEDQIHNGWVFLDDGKTPNRNSIPYLECPNHIIPLTALYIDSWKGWDDAWAMALDSPSAYGKITVETLP